MLIHIKPDLTDPIIHIKSRIMQSRPENIIQIYNKCPIRKKPAAQNESAMQRKKLTLDFVGDNPFHATYAPHEATRMFHTRNYVSHTTGEIPAKEFRKNPMSPESYGGRLRATPRKNIFAELLVEAKPSPKSRKQILSLKAKSRNIEELNATYSVGKGDHRKQMLFTGKAGRNEGSTATLQKRIRNLEEYAELLKAKIAELEEELGAEEGVGEAAYPNCEDLVKELEEIRNVYSTLSLDYARLKKNEEELVEKTKQITQDKETLVAEAEKKASQQRVKIMLLQEALTKRNEELNTAKKELVGMVILLVAVSKKHWRSTRAER